MKYTRMRDMEEYIIERDFVSLDELCEIFERSKNTIRRDVTELVQSGIVEKVYGGVRAAKPPSDIILSFTQRNIKRFAEKQIIGALAAEFVEDNDVIFIDAGTTTLTMLPHISERNGVTVLTNNLHAISRCMDYANINTILFGGQLDTETASFTSHFCSMDNLQSFNINKAFMAGAGVSIEKGITNISLGEMEIKQRIVQKSDKCFLMADSTKFNHSALLTYAPLETFRYVITDKQPSEEYLDFFSQHKMQLVTKIEE